MILLDLLRAGAVTVAATPALLLMRRAPGRVRHVAFAAVIAASAVAPFAVGLVPRQTLIPMAYSPEIGQPVSGSKYMPTLSPAARLASQTASVITTVPEPMQMPSWLLLLPAALPLGRMLLGWRTARRWAKRATPGPDGTLLSVDAAVPMTFFDGRHHRILLPAEAADWSEERLRAVLLHEKAHVARGDWWVQTAARTVVAFQWMNPLAWWMLRRLNDAAEEAADAAAVRGGIAPQAYAKELLSLALPGLRPVGSLPMTPKTDVGRRVIAVLKGLKPGSRWAVGFAAFAPLALVIPGAAVGSLRKAEESGYTLEWTGTGFKVRHEYKPQRMTDPTGMVREVPETMFGNAGNGWKAEFLDGKSAKLEYVVGWFKRQPVAWRPDGTIIPLKGLPIGPVQPEAEYVYDKKKKIYVPTKEWVENERMFVFSHDDPTGIMEGATQSSATFDGPRSSVFGRGSFTTHPGKPGIRYTAGFIAYSEGFKDIKGKEVFKAGVGFARGPLDATKTLTLDAKGLAVPASAALNQEGVSFDDGYNKKRPALQIVVKVKKVAQYPNAPWQVAVGRGKDGKVDTQGAALLYEGPKSFAKPFYRYDLPRPRAAYESVEIYSGATGVTNFDGVAIMPNGPLQSEGRP
ncbi:M56 family metallopeptidase [bacterium]|nr:MAG: M56 family metallopeptidase [bacterium]